MRFGCCASLEQMQRVQDVGYDYIELTVGTVKAEQAEIEFEPVRELLDSFDIRPEAWNCLIPGAMKVVGPEVDLYRVERYLRTAFERIEEVGGEIVVFGSGGARRVPEGFPMDEARDQLCEALTLAGQVAGAYGIMIALEPLASGSTNIINTFPQGAELVKRVDHPFVKLLADLQHMVDEGESPSAIGTLDVEIVHTHTADTGRLYPGSGSYPTREFIQVLKGVGYDERLSVECIWGDFYAECPKALKFLRELDART
jgi:D-psicose/D-tagatose/L-ribulose 3-epimerase